MTDLGRLHRRLLTIMALAALVAFVSGAGLETPSIVLVGAVLLLAMVWEPSPRLHARMEWGWRLLAVALALRAVHFVLTVPEDVVLPMVDVLLVLLASEALRPAETSERTRTYSLSFALLVAAAAYRAGVAFGLSFVVYITTGTVALMIGHLLRENRRFATRSAALPRGFLLRVASLASVMLFMSGLLFVAFPRVTRNWVSRGTPRGGAIVGFSDRVSLSEHGGTIYPNPEVVLRVEFPAAAPPPPRVLYWRGRSYDYFDGVGWWHSPRARSLSVPVRVYRQEWPRATIQPKIYAAPLQVPVLFTTHPVLSVRPISRMRWQPDPTGDVWYDATGPPIYELTSIARQPPDADLQRLPPAVLPEDAAYLQLPDLSPAVRRLADSLTSTSNTQIERVRSVESWLRARFRYTLDLPRTAREATLENFLFSRRAGHCEYFSTAMVILLRSVGIPARNVNGFLGGGWNEFGNFLTVTQNQAHSWVEVWFPRYGWLQFDPTPAAADEAAIAQRAWFGPFRFLVDGLEHRWNKWVLEYNLETQIDLFRRAASALTTPSESGSGRLRIPIRDLIPWALLALLVVGGIRTFRWRARAGSEALSPETRFYLRLRREYERGRWADANLPPLAFLGRIAGAPGSAHARIMVDLYLQSRFGRTDIGAVGRERMRQALLDARSELRSSRRAA